MEQKYNSNNVPHEVWLIVENFIFRNIHKGAMGEMLDPRILAAIYRIDTRPKAYGDRTNLCRHNYGRLALHFLRPRTYMKGFSRIHPQLENQVNIGGVGLSSERPHYIYTSHTIGYRHNTKDTLLKAIEINSNSRKIKGLKSMSKNQLFQTLMKLDEFKLE